MPLALVIDGANRHDMKLLCATLEGLVLARPEPTEAQPQHLCLDAGYDFPVIREQVETHAYLPHLRGRGQEKQEKIATTGFRARRWVVEQTPSWLNRFRRLLVRWEKKAQHALAFLHFACGLLALRAAGVFGEARSHSGGTAF
jgi:putative transposase